MNDEQKTSTLSTVPPQSSGASQSHVTIVAADLADPANEDQARGLFKKAEDIRYARVQLPTEKLRENLASFLSTIGVIVDELPTLVGSLELDTVVMSVEVSAKGTVSLLGTGGEVAGKGGLTFTLKKKTTS